MGTASLIAQRVIALAVGGAALSISAGVSPPREMRPTITYAVRVDSAQPGRLDVAIHVHGAPAALRLAMKVHAEYDARYWRFLSDMHVEHTADDSAAAIVREDSTLWRVTLPGGRGAVRYQVQVQPPAAPVRRAWQVSVRADGALLNPPDVFLYAPDYRHVPVTVELDAPRSWRIATALQSRGDPRRRVAADAAALLDSPILLGALREWTFAERGTTYHLVYWPLRDATPFDTLAFTNEVRRLARTAAAIFGRLPARDFWFLVQDGAGDALEHRASLTIGIASRDLAADPHASLIELAHEFVHSWNLVAIRPAGYNDLSYRPPARTPGLWLGEGVTLYYADVLARRAGLPVPIPSRLDHLARLLEHYYASPAIMRVSPERASLAFEDSPVENPDATGGYYLQGELLADVLDARVREATAERRGLDDVMRALFARSLGPTYRGFTSRDVVAASDSVCACRLDAFFAAQVRGSTPIDVAPVLQRLGLRLVVDSVSATDSAGAPLADDRLGMDFHAPPGVVKLVVSIPGSAWAKAGLQTGDELVTIGGASVRDYAALRGALRRLRIGERAIVEIRRDGSAMRIPVSITGYVRPRVRFVDAAVVTSGQRALRQAWMHGFSTTTEMRSH